MFYLSDEAILQRFAPVYESEGVTVTYRRYLGTERSAQGKNVDQFEEFSWKMLTGKRKKWSTNAVTKEVTCQEMLQSFIGRTNEMPDGVEPENLTRNDRILYLGQDMAISEIRIVKPFVRFAVEGG